jgi:hyperosmotically inducible periplasmic protein
MLGRNKMNNHRQLNICKLALMPCAAIALASMASQASALGTDDDRVQTPLYSEFKKLDKNNDGKLTREESTRDADIGPHFDKADKNKNDVLSSEEYSNFKSGIQQARVESFLDDSSVTAKVKAELLKDEGVKSLVIKVQTHHGQVILSGFVDTEEQARRAVEIATSVRGVLAVKNSLIVKG